MKNFESPPFPTHCGPKHERSEGKSKPSCLFDEGPPVHENRKTYLNGRLLKSEKLWESKNEEMAKREAKGLDRVVISGVGRQYRLMRRRGLMVFTSQLCELNE